MRHKYNNICESYCYDYHIIIYSDRYVISVVGTVLGIVNMVMSKQSMRLLLAYYANKVCLPSSILIDIVLLVVVTAVNIKLMLILD